MDRVLIDASNLHTGGGVQVAASFIDDVHVLRTRGTTPWLADWRPRRRSHDVSSMPTVGRRAERYIKLIDSSVSET